MALQRSFTTQDGTTYPAAYSRIVTVRCHKDLAYIFVNTYADEAARLREDEPVHQEEPQLEMVSLLGNVYQAAYAHLQTMPEFADAVTVPASDEPSAA